MEILILSLSVINLLLLLFLLWRSFSDKASSLSRSLEVIEKNQERIERNLREEISKNREELGDSLSKFRESLLARLDSLMKMNEDKLEMVRGVVDRNLKSLQDDNSAKLEKIRETVDEKLHSTLEKRLGDSFNIVCDRLDKVHEGLGDMKNLAAGVGDLKRVLTNVKTRGTWGEMQLENILEQVLTPDQYERNVATKKGSRDRVEFAIKLPGKNEETVYMPIDAKFPIEDYDRLLQAQEENNSVLMEEMGKAIENRIKAEAKSIKEKYIDPPHTSDFAILYLPTEGLYAEVLRRPGLCDFIQREYRVNLTGPTTVAALLNSLRMGFRTLAVEKRASDVWALLGSVKTEFGKFGDLLKKTHEKLKQASNDIEDAERKSRTIERKLDKVQELPTQQRPALVEEIELDSF